MALLPAWSGAGPGQANDMTVATRPAGAHLVPALLVVYVVWGSTYVALKIGVENLPPLGLSAVRFLLAGLVLYAWCAYRRRRHPDRGWRSPTPAEWRAGTIQGVLLPAAGTGGATWAEQRLPSGTTALLLATIPVWLVLIKRLVDKEPIGARAGAGLVAGVVGVAVLVNPFSGPAPDPLYAVVALAGALCWGAGTVYGQHAPHPEQPLLAAAVEMLGAGAVLAVLSAATGDYRGLHVDAGRSVAALAYLVVFGSLLAYPTYEWLLRNAPSRLVGTYAFVNPLVAVVLGWWLLGESVGGRTALAAGVIAVGVALIVVGPGRRGGRPPVSRTRRAARSSRCSSSGSYAAR
jgi:drug/metabolite transporter (DMT)-like permease